MVSVREYRNWKMCYSHHFNTQYSVLTVTHGNIKHKLR